MLKSGLDSLQMGGMLCLSNTNLLGRVWHTRAKVGEFKTSMEGHVEDTVDGRVCALRSEGLLCSGCDAIVGLCCRRLKAPEAIEGRAMGEALASSQLENWDRPS